MAAKGRDRKGELVEWVMKDMAAQKGAQSQSGLTKRRSLHTLPASEVGAHPRYLPLAIWAQMMFGEHGPHYNTLLRWVHEGLIQPQPKKMGRFWFVKTDAEYVSD